MAENNVQKEPVNGVLGIVQQAGYDTESGVYGYGYSPDNGKTFYVQDTIHGRKYRQEDANRIGNLSFGKLKFKSPSGTTFYLSVSDEGQPVFTKTSSNNHNASFLQDVQIGTLYTDKSFYKPGETVVISFDANSTGTVTIDVFDLANKVYEQKLNVIAGGNSFSWKIPNDDYKGYMVKVSSKNAEFISINVNNHVEYAPIMGFLGNFSPDLGKEQMKKVVKEMARYHVNYVQFYDWYDRDDTPLRLINGNPEQTWIDFMKRPISFNTVKTYIDIVHGFGMQAMFYNLIYGSQLGIPTSNDKNLNWVNPNLTKEMFLFKDPECKTPAGENDQSFGGKLNITYMNVLNSAWQEYLNEQSDIVYKYLNFDGWHVDQLGTLPAETYSSDGYHLNWWEFGDGYGGMLKTAKRHQPSKRLTINNADNIGIEKVMASNTVDFTYVEPWAGVGYALGNLAHEIRTVVEKYGKPMVIPSYVNKEKAEHSDGSDHMVNDAAALLCDAMEMSNGASHLEWGEHYLANEYFPNNQLTLRDSSKMRIMHYIDIYVGYLQILNGKWIDDQIASSSHSLSNNFEKGKVTTVYKRSDHGSIVSLVNMIGVAHDNWQDPNGTQVMPEIQNNIQLTVPVDGKITDVYLIKADESPELNPISFKQDGNKTSFTVDKLDVWDLILLKG